jgi:hypothetical protein
MTCYLYLTKKHLRILIFALVLVVILNFIYNSSAYVSNKNKDNVKSKSDLKACSYELEKKPSNFYVWFWRVVETARSSLMGKFLFLKAYENPIDSRNFSFEMIKVNMLLKIIQLSEGGTSLTEVNSKCDSSSFKYRRLAIIGPHRNRLENLRIFLNNMHPYWTRHKLNYAVYIIEPLEGLSFNRGLLMNIGFMESLRDYQDWDCFVFHDVKTWYFFGRSILLKTTWFFIISLMDGVKVDMIPEDERVPYTCDEKLPGTWHPWDQKSFDRTHLYDSFHFLSPFSCSCGKI